MAAELKTNKKTKIMPEFKENTSPAMKRSGFKLILT